MISYRTVQTKLSHVIREQPQAAYPSKLADDQAWSRIVLPQRDDVVEQLSQADKGGSIPTTSRRRATSALNCCACTSGMAPDPLQLVMLLVQALLQEE